MKRLPISILAIAAGIALPVCRGSARLEELAAGLDAKISTLSNIVLRERISRYSQVGNKVCKLDTFQTLVNIADGTEQYSDVRKNNKTYSHVSQIPGVWSFGETVTMLRTTRDALHEPIPESDAMGFHFGAGDRRWFVLFDSRTYWLDFDGTARINPGSAAIDQIVWTSGLLPRETGIERITWTVDFQPVEIAGRHCTVPKTGTYRVARIGNRAEWNVTEFSVVGLYGSESAVRFDR